MDELYPPSYKEYNNINYIPKEKLICCKEVYKLQFDKCIKQLNQKILQFRHLNEWHQLYEDEHMYYGTLKNILFLTT